MLRVLVTGVAGFIGFHLSQRLLENGAEVVGIDNLNDYYDITLKLNRLAQLEGKSRFKFFKVDLAHQTSIQELFSQHEFDIVVNLAAQAGVRYSIKNPHAYINSNLVGFTNILESCRHSNIKHLVYASSSSVYGANTNVPFSVRHSVDHPISLYAATKKANELMAHTYSHLYGLPTTGLRFFTVYGPWGRPDMALFLFTKSILEGTPIDVFNYGQMKRDFTYIEDIIEGVLRVISFIPKPSPNWSSDSPIPGISYAPYRVYNIGNNRPVELLHFIQVLEDCLGVKAKKNLLPLQPGDVPYTYADIEDLFSDLEFRPKTSIEKGIEKFVIWYRDYYK